MPRPCASNASLPGMSICIYLEHGEGADPLKMKRLSLSGGGAAGRRKHELPPTPIQGHQCCSRSSPVGPEDVHICIVTAVPLHGLHRQVSSTNATPCPSRTVPPPGAGSYTEAKASRQAIDREGSHIPLSLHLRWRSGRRSTAPRRWLGYGGSGGRGQDAGGVYVAADREASVPLRSSTRTR
ncbi:unnamed protein product [Urochloa humidicola]